MKIYNTRQSSELDVYSTFTPLNYILNLFGLSYIYSDGGELKHSNSIRKVLILTTIFSIINIITIYLKFQSYKGRITFGFKDTLEMSYLVGYIHYLVDVTLVYKYGRQSYISYFSLYDYVDRILGTPYYDKIKRNIKTMCIFYVIIFVITTVIDYVAWTFAYGLIITTIFSIDYMYLGLRMLSALDMISNCIQVTYRLETIGDLLVDYYYETDTPSGVVKDTISNKAWVISEDSNCGVNNLKVITYSQHNIVLWLSRCYLLLNEQSDHINMMFGCRILLNCLFCLVDVVLILNFVIRMIVGTVYVSHNLGPLPIVSMLMRGVKSSLILFCAFRQCEQNYKETKRIIGLIDYLLINKKTTIEIREQLNELKDLIISRPVNYHASYFFRLDYSTLVSLASVIISYTIILLQNME